jgi:hypothetical protein
MKTVQFKKWTCTLDYANYANKRVAIRLMDANPEEPGVVAVATVNVPDRRLKDDEVIIKDYSENMGVLQALVEAGIVKDTGRTVQLGFVHGHICKLLIDKQAYHAENNNR